MQKYFDGAKDVALSDFNKVYSQVINAKKLLFAAQFKNDVGLFGRLFGLAVGEVGGQAVMPGPVGKMVGMTAGEIASNTLAPTGRNLLERLLSHPDAPGAAAKVTTGVSDAQETNSQ